MKDTTPSAHEDESGRKFDVAALLAQSANEIAQIAEDARAAGDVTGGHALLEAAISTHPHSAELLHMLGKARAEIGDSGGAIDALTRAIELGSQSEADRGLVFDLAGDDARAVLDYEVALSRNPDEVDVLINLGTITLAARDIARATALLERAASLDARANWQLADVFQITGDNERAIAALKLAIEAGELRAYSELADIESDSASKTTVVDHYTRAIEAGSTWARRGLAVYLDLRGDRDEALSVARDGVAAGDALCHAPLAVMLEDEGDTEGAIAHYRLAIADGDEIYEEDLAALLRDR